MVIRGRLEDERGRPISGALVQAVSRADADPPAPRRSASVRTGRDGRFRYVAPPGPSRRVRLGYRTYTNDLRYAASTEVVIAVRPVVRLAVHPRRVRNGRSVTFTGRLRGAPLPRFGKLVELQARVGRSWRTFAVPRTDRHGRFRQRYRFRRTHSTVRYRFRALVRREAGYPFRRGRSNVASVVVVGR